MSADRHSIRDYIEHFLRYSKSVNYKNITFAMMAVGAVELFNRNSHKLVESAIKLHLSDLVALEGSIAPLCLNQTILNFDFRAALELSRAFDFGYMQVINGKPEVYAPHFIQKLAAHSCADFMSAEDLANIDNVIRILSYGLIAKLFMDAIPPRMSKATDIPTALLRSLMIGQKEAPYFPDLIAKMITELGLTEGHFEEGLKKSDVYLRCPFTQGPILFPVTTNGGKSYDITSLAMLKASSIDPVTTQPLTGIYYNKTLFSIISHGVLKVLQENGISEEEQQKFMAQWMRIHTSFQKNLYQRAPLLGAQPQKEEPVFPIIAALGAVLAYLGRLGLPILIPFACQEELGGWHNPLPQLCADFVSALQLATKGFQGAFEYGVASASKCLEHYTLEECNTNAMKSASLNNPYGIDRDLYVVRAEKAEDSFMLLMLYTFIPSLLFVLLVQMTLLGIKSWRGDPEREKDIQDAYDALKGSAQSEVEINVGPTLQQLQQRARDIPSAQKDKASILVLCTGCSISHFRTEFEQHKKECVSTAELISDRDTSELITAPQ